MAHRDIVVIGASSGGVEALTNLVAGLPERVPAAVFIVLHIRPDAPSQLPAILNRAGRLPAAHAVDGEPIRLGRIYVAPPGLQTYVERSRIGVRRAPAENLHRPAIDPLFRTAAHHHRGRVIGIVLSGQRDDGTAGLLAIRRGGGLVIVQDPVDAMFPSMPVNAMESADADYCVRSAEIGPLVARLVGQQLAAPALAVEIPLETVEEAHNSAAALRADQLGRPSSLTCPECQGALWEVAAGSHLKYRCRVGHAFSEQTMLAAQSESIERALWTALRALEERSATMRRAAEHARERGYLSVASSFDERSERIESDVRMLHDLITNGRALEPMPESEPGEPVLNDATNK
jgi:two-component system chemotaxis response regulator CheB